MTPEQFLTHLRELKVAAVRAKLYTEALILDQADLDIQTYHEEKTALCQPCTPPAPAFFDPLSQHIQYYGTEEFI